MVVLCGSRWMLPAFEIITTIFGWWLLDGCEISHEIILVVLQERCEIKVYSFERL